MTRFSLLAAAWLAALSTLRLDRRTWNALTAPPEVFEDFSGGLNLRDYPNVAPNELIQALNVHIVGKRLRAIRGATFGQAITGKTIIEAWWSETLSTTVVHCTDGQLYNLSTGLVLAGAPAVSTLGCWIVDFNGLLVLGSAFAGIYTTNGGGVWTLATNAIKPTMLAVWQNKVWAIGDNAFPNRLWACNAGNAGTWTTATDWVEIPEGGTQGLTCVIATQQQDYQGRPSLLVYKRRTSIRINSSNATTGFTYTVLAVGAGCAGRRAACSDLGFVLAFDDTGIWQTDGVATPKPISGKISPMFGAQQAGMPTLLGGTLDSLISSASKAGKFFFACSYDGTATCTVTVVWDSETGAFSFYRPCRSTGADVMDLRSMHRRVDVNSGIVNVYAIHGAAATNVQVFVDDDLATSTKDEIRVQTGFLALAQGRKFNARNARIEARIGGTMRLDVLADWTQTVRGTRNFAAGSGTPPQLLPYDAWQVGRWKAVSLLLSLQNAGSPLQWTVTADPAGPTAQAPYDKPQPPFELERLSFIVAGAGRL